MFMFHIKTSFILQLIKKMYVKEKFERVALAVLCLSKVFNAVRLRNVVCVYEMISTMSGVTTTRV